MKKIIFLFLFIFPLFSNAKKLSTVKPDIQAWMTSLDGSKKMSSVPPESISLEPCGKLPKSVTSVAIDESKTFQNVTGFGAALTESSALLLSKMDKVQRKKIIAKIFGSETISRFNLIRIPIGATDFSTGNYSCADAPAKETKTSPSVKTLFDFNRCMGNILPILSEIKKSNPNLKIIATPWSPPAWMKSTKSLVGGTLLPKYFEDYAQYLSLFIAMMEQAGFQIDYLTVVNEPLYVVEHPVTYPWTHMDAEDQARFIGKFLGPLLAKNNQLSKVKILGYDHNWDKWNYPATLLNNPESKKFLAGTAFHCYGGNFSAAKNIKDLDPSKELHLTECTSGKWSSNFGDSFSWALTNLFIGHFSVGSQSLVYWNLLLDADGGPKNGGCQDCRGVINLKAHSKDIEESPEYYALAQAAAVVNPSAVRIASSSSNMNSQIAFKNPDNSLAWIGINSSERASELKLNYSKGCLSTNLPAKTAISIKWY
ncbi:MAG: glycoside hydrolase family 30 protein [Bdellovibrio sp.]